eukprot:TRINITY_DN2174_c0_g1_i1.p1 TRINITY_DN2174_c0_g1~~TRINITY_DN2174_c0_g1_i1.p1  ORF type:complete len:350 (+),score=102.36 TRINITY_DN2174_c0_g1_i1:60-1109(+)
MHRSPFSVTIEGKATSEQWEEEAGGALLAHSRELAGHCAEERRRRRWCCVAVSPGYAFARAATRVWCVVGGVATPCGELSAACSSLFFSFAACAADYTLRVMIEVGAGGMPQPSAAPVEKPVDEPEKPRNPRVSKIFYEELATAFNEGKVDATLVSNSLRQSIQDADIEADLTSRLHALKLLDLRQLQQLHEVMDWVQVQLDTRLPQNDALQSSLDGLWACLLSEETCISEVAHQFAANIQGPTLFVLTSRGDTPAQRVQQAERILASLQNRVSTTLDAILREHPILAHHPYPLVWTGSARLRAEAIVTRVQEQCLDTVPRADAAHAECRRLHLQADRIMAMFARQIVG